ncbi:MAG TPA: hypothetical protein VHV52_11675 [Gaiellaceae bacterium]|nr:hypothetical protein [Gaiellaceae bacterium]
MSVAEQWKAIGSNLPEGWVRASLRLELVDRGAADSAAALLGPAGPYRSAPTVLLITVARDGTSTSPDSIVRLLRRVPAGTLSLSGSQGAPQRTATRETTPLTVAWDRAIGALPADWSDLYAEIQLTSSDFVERAAVLCIQCNPRREGQRAAFRFRAARRAGYGVAAAMARRCFERCDAEGITGSIEVLRVLSDTQLVATQGPVWISEGRTI